MTGARECIAHSFSMAVGGIGVTLAIDDRRLFETAAGRYAAFTTESASNSLEIRVGVSSLRTPAAGPRDLAVEDTGTGLSARRFDLSGAIALGQGRAEVELFWPEFSALGLDCFLRLCYSVLAVESGSLLLHCASVARAGQGWAFAGRSGSGKSTVAGLSERAGGSVMSDELTMLSRGEEGWTMSGTPFHGDQGLGRNLTESLGGLFFLRKSDEHKIRLIDEWEALRRFCRCVVFFGEKTGLVPKAFDLCCEAVGSIPMREMQFKRDTGLWELIDAVPLR